MKRRILLASTVTTIVALTIAGTVFAYAAYHGTWSEQPYYGNHWWYKDDPNGSLLTWYADDQWTQSTADSMKYWHTHFPWNEYRIEQEAYNPGAGTSCDRLAIYSYSAMDLPVTGWTSSNGCGSSTYKEELKIEFDENSISANTWYRHKVVYAKYQICTGGNGEVNYSFSHNHSASDSWLGKITYDTCFNKTGSDPSGMVN